VNELPEILFYSERLYTIVSWLKTSSLEEHQFSNTVLQAINLSEDDKKWIITVKLATALTIIYGTLNGAPNTGTKCSNRTNTEHFVQLS
jgi:hypothetical protein